MRPYQLIAEPVLLPLHWRISTLTILHLYLVLRDHWFLVSKLSMGTSAFHGSDDVVPMLALRTPFLSALFVFFSVQVSVISVNCARWNQRRTSSIAATSEPLSKLCIPFSQEAVASANLTKAEESILPELCYRPDLAPSLSGTEGDRGIPIGVECTPFQW